MTPTAVFGVPLYNGEQHLAEALESLIGQTCTDLAVVMVDDGSTDSTAEIAQRYAALDGRLSYERNEHRLGMTRNWCRVLERARALHGDFPYFAWGSDHDVWHPRWLALMIAALDAAPEATAAYPLDVGISDGGVVIREPWRFEVRGEEARGGRLDRAIFGMSAGNMAYALFRADNLERAEALRSIVLPDRLMLAELALHGELHQVPEVLWYRRYRLGVKPSLRRQRQSFFPDGVPLWSYAPWPLSHSVLLFRSLVVRGRGLPNVGRLAGAGYALRYLVVSSVYNIRIRWKKSKKRHRLMKRLRARRTYLVRLLKGILRRAGLLPLARALRRRLRTRVVLR